MEATITPDAETHSSGSLAGLARYGKSFAIGAAFAVGWTPCIGPILAAVLALAADSGTVLKGAFLLGAWSLGLGVPFLIAGAMLGQVMRAIRKARPVMPVLEVLGGLLVITIGALIFLDKFTVFNQYFTGGVGTGDTLNEATVGRDYLAQLGLPTAALVALPAGDDTYASLAQVRRWFEGRGSRRVLLVSDGFHMLRLRIIAPRLGLVPLTSPAPGSPIRANLRRNTTYLLAEGFKVPFTWLFQH